MAKEKKWHSGMNALQDQRERNMFRVAGLPSQILRKPRETYEYGMQLVEDMKKIEEKMTKWEDLQPIEFLELLPWWEGRKRYRELKALGDVPEVTWWEAIAFVENGYPRGITNGTEWGYKKKKKHPGRKKLPKEL